MVVASSIGWWWMPYAIVGGESSSSRATLSECILLQADSARHKKRSRDPQEKDSSVLYLYYCSLGSVIKASSFKRYIFLLY